MSCYLRGKKAEEIALYYLVDKGYQLIAQRYCMWGGEIDLLMTHQEYLIAIEVRLRKSLNTAAESITLKKKQRLTKTLRHFTMQHPDVVEKHPYMRFDVVLIDQDAKVYHIENAFGEENE